MAEMGQNATLNRAHVAALVAGQVTSPDPWFALRLLRFARLFSDEPEIEANQKHGEMDEAAIKQEFWFKCGAENSQGIGN